MSIKLELYYGDRLNKIILHYLINEDIPIEDIEYIIFIDSVYSWNFKEFEHSVTKRMMGMPLSRTLDDLLRGGVYKKWFPVENFDEKKGFVGIAYA